MKNISQVTPPYLLTEAEWGQKMLSAKRLLRGDYVQERVTKSSASVMVSAAKTISFLEFGIREDISKKLTLVQSGKLVLSEAETALFIEQLENRVTFSDVLDKAKSLGLM
ncbi:hypothetical protein [Pseudoalteromonas prydzensis]|uniref:hypothetical protein n=1 Tax=Pseudoalteromonas prydzensis TaxID=182141 RepID=UPI003FD2EBB9